MNERKARLESLLHREIAVTVQQEVKDPRLGFITITRVAMSEDLLTAKAYWTCLGDEKQRRLAAHALESARGFVQKRYAPVIKSRNVPSLTFVHDAQDVQRSDLDELIRKARATDSDGGTKPEPASTQTLPEKLGH
jgi:ribosome-binding factor A